MSYKGMLISLWNHALGLCLSPHVKSKGTLFGKHD